MATGKIARLPRAIREELNERLVGGAPGGRLAAWLNGLPAVQALLAADFGGSAINEQNLSNWRRGGHRDWRAEREARDLSQSLAGEAVPVVTAEQLASSLTVRYLMVIREWQREAMPVERRWRQLRVMCGDILKLRRSEYQAARLELDGERLEFAMERFAEEQQTDERRAMVGFLGAARQWPEVQEALAAAFRLFRERKEAETEGKEAELEPIKVNQGGKNKIEEAQDKSVGCSPSPVSSPPGRGDDLARFWVQGSTTASTAVGARMDANKAELGAIKVNQGRKFKKVEGQAEMGCFPARDGNRPSGHHGPLTPRRSAETPLQANLPSWCPAFRTGGKSELMGHNGSEIFYPGREGPDVICPAKDTLIKHDRHGPNPAGQEMSCLRACVRIGAN